MPYRSVLSTAAVVLLLATGFTSVSAEAASVTFGRLGVHAGLGKRPDTIDHLTELGARWVRLNIGLDGTSPDFRSFRRRVNVVITFNNADPTTPIARLTAFAQWPNAGFPYKSKAVYQQRIRDTLTPLLPYLSAAARSGFNAKTRSAMPRSPPTGARRGTTDQYRPVAGILRGGARAASGAGGGHDQLRFREPGCGHQSADPKYAYQTRA